MTQEQPPVLQRRGDPKYTWDDTVAAIGQDFAEGPEHVADETIAYNDVIRYCEVWEYGNSLYWDEEVAKRAGYRGVVVPWSAIKQTFSYRGSWRPGEPTRFPLDAHKDVMGKMASYSIAGREIPMPPTTQGLNTGMSIEFFEPVIVGDRITVKGRKLVEVRPRQTRIGFGAFTVTESSIYNQRGELVAKIGEAGYAYNTGEGIPQ